MAVRSKEAGAAPDNIRPQFSQHRSDQRGVGLEQFRREELKDDWAPNQLHRYRQQHTAGGFQVSISMIEPEKIDSDQCREETDTEPVRQQAAQQEAAQQQQGSANANQGNAVNALLTAETHTQEARAVLTVGRAAVETVEALIAPMSRITIRASCSARSREISPSLIIPVSAMPSARRVVVAPTHAMRSLFCVRPSPPA